MVCPGLSRFEPRRQLSRRCLALVGVRRRHPNSGIGRTPKRMSDSSCAGPSLPRSLLAAGAAGRPRRRAVRWPAAAAAAPRSVYARSTLGLLRGRVLRHRARAQPRRRLRQSQIEARALAVGAVAHAREHAAHVGEAGDHARHGIVGVDLVLQIDEALIVGRD
jgi:hypothetical protein